MSLSPQGFDTDSVKLALSLVRAIARDLAPDLAYDAYTRLAWEAVGRDRDGLSLLPTARAWFDRAFERVRAQPMAVNQEEIQAELPLVLKCRRTGVQLFRTTVGFAQKPARAVLSTEHVSCTAWISCISAALETLVTPARHLVVPPLGPYNEVPFLLYCRSAGLTPLLL